MAKALALNMPIHIVLEAPAMWTMGGPAYRAIITISVAYWQSGCQSIPSDVSNLALLARLPAQHLLPYEKDVRRGLAEILPELASIHADMLVKRAAKSRKAQDMTLQRIANHRMSKAKEFTTELSIEALPLKTGGVSRRIAAHENQQTAPRPASPHGPSPARPFKGPGFTD
jgi:hypothetical protein